jgi:hypothetical protein
MRTLEDWLLTATRCLSADSAHRVRAEIEPHYLSSREEALLAGATPAQADHQALTALGDPNEAHRQFRRVLLTRTEARVLREGNWEYRAVCSRPLLLWALRTVPVAALCAGIAYFARGENTLTLAFLLVAAGAGLMMAPAFVPIRTHRQGRIVRWLKLGWCLALVWALVELGDAWLAFSSLVPSLWILAWIEWTRASIRRKLPVDQWPRHLLS